MNVNVNECGNECKHRYRIPVVSKVNVNRRAIKLDLCIKTCSANAAKGKSVGAKICGMLAILEQD